MFPGPLALQISLIRIGWGDLNHREAVKGIRQKVKARAGRVSGHERVNVAAGRMRCPLNNTTR
jgi:hypothetical protein